MGRIRNLESDYSEESAQRMAAENTALKQRAQRIANLEAELVAPASGP
jgi:hypothetical protein